MSGAKSVTATFSADPTQADANPGAAPALGDDCTIRGTRGNDVLSGTPRRDVICGLAGRDTLIGRAGNDVLRGGAGGDLLRGGRGRDLLNGGAGVDRARVESHRDTRKSIERVL
jgi:Ca2+-binding RTX toxin-like protein